MSLEGHQLGEFEILERIGQGGMGAVYRARQTRLDRLVAIKTLQTSLADDEEYIARFQQEAKAAAGLNHPNLVQVHSAGEDDGLHWFAMEFVEGESAKVRLKRKGRIEPLEAIAIAIHVATALEYGWRKAQLIHRDIKPDNIFLSEDGEVKLGDLGLAKSAGQTQGLTMTGHSMGTPHYISPEQVESTKNVDLRADIYSLGCTLYHMLSGRVPFDGNSAVSIMVKHINEPVPVLKAAWPECPQVLNEVVGKMMQKDAAERQQDYSEVIGDLRQAYEVVSNQDAPTMVVPEATPQPQSVPAATPAPKPRVPAAKDHEASTRKSPLPVYAAIAAVMVAIAGVCFFAFKPKEHQFTQAQRSAQEHAEEESVENSETVSSTGYPQPKHWMDVTANVRDRGLQTGNLVADGEWLTLAKDKASYNGQCAAASTGNAIAVRVIYSKGVDIVLRTSNLNYNGHMLHRASIGYYDSSGRKLTDLMGDVNPPEGYMEEAEHELVFSAQGSRLNLWLDGREVAKAQVPPVVVTHSVVEWFPNSRIKKIEYGELDGAESSKATTDSTSSTPSTATKETPFVNSLGMKFVPVPIVSGPSAGQRVLFGVWDVRVQDYAVYAAANPKVDGAWRTQHKDGVPAGRELDHPVVGVSWEDAQAFCQWLTEKEIAEGKLPKGLKYRLPSDEEWSWAVGMPPELGTTPAEKNGKNSVDFPWGKDYPPTKKVGNYADEAFHAKFPVKKNDKTNAMDNQWIEGYNDGYATTSPVGSFPANTYGLYDMGGNVWQWCEDWFDASQKDRVLRGASWLNYARGSPGSLLSSSRYHDLPTARYDHHGFRCVVAPVDASPAPVTTPATPPKIHRLRTPLE